MVEQGGNGHGETPLEQIINSVNSAPLWCGVINKAKFVS